MDRVELLAPACDHCGGTDFTDVVESFDYEREDAMAFSVARCAGCGLMATRPRPSMEDLIRHFYKDDYHCCVRPGRGSLPARLLERFFDYRTNEPRLRRLRALFPGRRISVLDVGCGNGSLLRYLAARTDWELRGVEPNDAARAVCLEAGVRADAGFLEDQGYEDGRFDAVTLTHVLEHVDSPSALLREIRRILKPGGLLLLEVPNGDALDVRQMGKYWWGWHLPRHLHHFTVGTLSAVAAEAGLELTEHRLPLRFGSMAWNFSILSRWHPRLRNAPLMPLSAANPLLLLLAVPFETANRLLGRSSIFEAVLRRA